MNLQPFRLDIDELINDFAQGEMTLLEEMKKVWMAKRFSCIFVAYKPTTKPGFFMQSLYAHCLGYMTSTKSLSHRLGGLYCLYCLHETQPFKPPFRIYLSISELKRLKELVADAKKENIEVVYCFVNHMIHRNLFLYGASEFKQEGSIEEEACAQNPNKRLCADTEIEGYNHMDLVNEVDLDVLKNMSTDYGVTKKLAIQEAVKVINTQDMKDIAEDLTLMGDVVEQTTQDWNIHQETVLPENGTQRTPYIGKPEPK
ncbi:small nuclear RNA activating complex (SNAPc), subunit SNAP43 protein [Artemisia annua]|uniref:Small nuclear RNA activating complex (SNAPc), subunit SNAP43 protein n=1 Tax=Artemisia annua TaxID=35608 RepID=A0A2U1QLU7_ARTAN|nr:small nuclear RNA activating complex (SNAPc), subunit SNAP43 protein [Artemisia annua]